MTKKNKLLNETNSYKIFLIITNHTYKKWLSSLFCSILLYLDLVKVIQKSVIPFFFRTLILKAVDDIYSENSLLLPKVTPEEGSM